MASDIFLKIAFPHESLAHRVDHQLVKLGTDFDRLGESFLDLIADALKFNDVPGRAHDALIKHCRAPDSISSSSRTTSSGWMTCCTDSTTQSSISWATSSSRPARSVPIKVPRTSATIS